MRLVYLLACMVAMWATLGHCDIEGQEGAKTEPQHDGLSGDYEGDSSQMDYNQLQYAKRTAGEVEGDVTRDEDYDKQFTEEDGRPAEPKPGVIQACYEKERENIDNSGVDTSNKTISRPFVYYVNKKLWFPYLKCCPRVWNYGCRHINARLPCFVNYNKYFREWCCPLWHVSVARCLCHECAIQTNTAVHKGTCQKRYLKKKFWAVCNRLGWKYTRLISMWVPHSCYCRVD